MSDLSTRLREVIEERLSVARAAVNDSGHWRWDHSFGDMCNDAECPFGALLDVADKGSTVQGTVLMQVHGYDVTDAWQGAAHIALNDPADAILAGEWALSIVGRHRRVAPGLKCGCRDAMCSEGSHTLWPCDEIVALAARYGVGVE